MRSSRRDRATDSHLPGWTGRRGYRTLSSLLRSRIKRGRIDQRPPRAGVVEIGTAGEQGLRDGVTKMSALPRSSQSTSESDSQNLPLTASIGIDEPTSIKSRANVKSLQSEKLEFADFTSFADRRQSALRTVGATTTPDGMRLPAHWSRQPWRPATGVALSTHRKPAFREVHWRRGRDRTPDRQTGKTGITISSQLFLDKRLQNPASTSMDVHSPLLQTNV
jgi:hypothetical protein